MYVHLLDVAEHALHQCVECKYNPDGKGGSEVTEICYSYEFLDDYVTPKPTLNAFMADIFQWRPEDKHKKMVEEGATDEMAMGEYVPPKSTPTVQGLQHIDDETAKDRPKYEREDGDNDWLQQKFNRKNHPLELMVSFN